VVLDCFHTLRELRARTNDNLGMNEIENEPLCETLDVRHLPAPEPMQRALQAADALQPGQRVLVLTPFMPQPLFPLLEARGLRWQTEVCADGSARVLLIGPPA
jgi:uncharacterized protein (DUF2249 family)